MPENQSSTHREHVGDGAYVRIQHCEFRNPDGTICNHYLGVEYPNIFCWDHQRLVNQKLQNIW